MVPKNSPNPPQKHFLSHKEDTKREIMASCTLAFTPYTLNYGSNAELGNF